MIQVALGEATLSEADSRAVADATVGALELLLGELKPLIGMLALRALYLRSLQLAHASFVRPGAGLELAELLVHLHRDLLSRHPTQARAAAQALLLALANLLVSLIGEPLTDRLLHKAWTPPPVAKTSETKPT